MPFKREPSGIAIIRSILENIPRRVTGRPPISRPHDPEVCGPLYEGYITAAFNNVNTRINDIKLMGGECSKLGTCLDGKSVSSVYITCANCIGGRPSSSDASDASIQLCLSAYGTTLNQATVNGLVLRELIRMCGGMELDAWGLYAYFSYVVPGNPPVYYPVPSAEKDHMCSGSTPGTANLAGFRAGKFLVWYPPNGKLWPKTLNPPPWSVLASNPLTGVLGHQHWQHPCP